MKTKIFIILFLFLCIGKTTAGSTETITYEVKFNSSDFEIKTLNGDTSRITS